MDETLKAAMDAARSARDSHGITLAENGRKYLGVKERVDIFRTHFGTSFGVCTELSHFDPAGGLAVVVARVLDHTGRTIGSGLGTQRFRATASGVGDLSPIECAETKAIGRALASLGLHGGEYASADEIRGVGQAPQIDDSAADAEEDLDNGDKGLDSAAELRQAAKAEAEAERIFTKMNMPHTMAEAMKVADMMVAIIKNRNLIRNSHSLTEFRRDNVEVVNELMKKWKPAYKRWSDTLSEVMKEMRNG